MGLPKLISQFTDEIEGVDEYMRCAAADAKHRDMYRQMAQAEYEHATMLKQMIDEYSTATRTADESEKLLKSLLESVGSMTAGDLSKAKSKLGR